MKVMTARYPGRCRDCGAPVAPGDRIVFRGRGKGITCNRCSTGDTNNPRCEGWGEPLGQTLSRLDPYGVYTADGRRMGSTCGCEDYPCCGH